MSHMDPRNASRTPSASKEPTYRLRYQSPVNACKFLDIIFQIYFSKDFYLPNFDFFVLAPSRNVDHPRPWEEEELMDRSSSYRSSVGRSVGAIPSYNGKILF